MEIDPEALRAVYAVAPPEKREQIEDALEEIDPRYRRGGPLYQPFDRQGFTTEEEFLAWREARLDRVRWTERDADGETSASAEAARMLQRENPVAHGNGGGGGGKRHTEHRKINSQKIVILEGKAAICVRGFHVCGLTRGANWYYAACEGAARAIVSQLAKRLKLLQYDFPRAIPRRTVAKTRTWERVVWLTEEVDVDVLRENKRIATHELNLHARECSDDRIRRKVLYLNALDSMGQTCEDLGHEKGGSAPNAP